MRPVGVLARRSDHADGMCTKLQVVDHYEKPRNVGSFDKKDIDVGTGLVGAPACGDVMKLQIRVRELYALELQLLDSVHLPAVFCYQYYCLLQLGGRLPGSGIIPSSVLQVDEAGNIVDSCFKTFGCGSAIASSSVATEWLVHPTSAQVPGSPVQSSRPSLRAPWHAATSVAAMEHGTAGFCRKVA